MKNFKDILPGFFRASNMLCYTKLEKEIQLDEEKKANAVIITNGQFRFFGDNEQVEDI